LFKYDAGDNAVYSILKLVVNQRPLAKAYLACEVAFTHRLILLFPRLQTVFADVALGKKLHVVGKHVCPVRGGMKLVAGKVLTLKAHVHFMLHGADIVLATLR